MIYKNKEVELGVKPATDGGFVDTPPGRILLKDLDTPPGTPPSAERWIHFRDEVPLPLHHPWLAPRVPLPTPGTVTTRKPAASSSEVAPYKQIWKIETNRNK